MEWIYLFLSLAAMMVGANWLVRGCSGIARQLNISEFIVSVIIIGIGTSLPELMVAILSGTSNMDTLVVTNGIASNIINIFGVLGIGALIYPIVISGKQCQPDITFLAIASVLIAAMIVYPPIGFIDGLLLLGMLFVYLVWVWKKQEKRTVGHYHRHLFHHHYNRSHPVYKLIFFIAAGFVVLYISSEYFMNLLQLISNRYHISQTMAGILIVAPGTSVPELLVTVIASIKRKPAVAIGNIIGSNFMNVVLIIAAGALISDLNVSRHIFYFDIWVMLFATVLLCIDLFYRQRISRLTGALYLALLVIYLYISVVLGNF